MVDGLPVEEAAPDRVAGAVCRPCPEGKMARAPFSESTTNSAAMELLHVKNTGPCPESIVRSCYSLVFYEDSAAFAMGVPIRAKSDAIQALKGRIPKLERP